MTVDRLAGLAASRCDAGRGQAPVQRVVVRGGERWKVLDARRERSSRAVQRHPSCGRAVRPSGSRSRRRRRSHARHETGLPRPVRSWRRSPRAPCGSRYPARSRTCGDSDATSRSGPRQGGLSTNPRGPSPGVWITGRIRPVRGGSMVRGRPPRAPAAAVAGGARALASRRRAMARPVRRGRRRSRRRLRDQRAARRGRAASRGVERAQHGPLLERELLGGHEPRQRRARCPRRWRRSAPGAGSTNADPEPGTDATRQLAAHRPGEVAGDRQPEAGAGDASRGRPCGRSARRSGRGPRSRCPAPSSRTAKIADRPVGPGGEPDVAARGDELQRIADEVREDLLDASPVGDGHPHPRRQVRR